MCTALREMSALAAMLMHLTVNHRSAAQAQIANERRTRTPYGTYPTSPQIASAMARYILRHLTSRAGPRRALRIMDPTLEGGPTLLELGFQIRSKQSGRRGSIPDVVLIGADQNPLSASLVATLLSSWDDRDREKSPQFDLRTADAFETLESGEPIDAISNNPPWGALTDGATNARVTPFGPYVGYRDPYIALVSTGLKRLRPGAPFAYVLPFQVLTAPSASRLREELLSKSILDHIVLLPRNAFPRATIKSVLLLGRRLGSRLNRRALRVVKYPMMRKLSDTSLPAVSTTAQRELLTVRGAPWLAIARSGTPVIPHRLTCLLGSVAEVSAGLRPYGRGRGTPKQTARTLRERPFTFSTPTAGTTPVLRSGDIRRYGTTASTEYTRIGRWLAYTGEHVKFRQHTRVFVREICGRDGSLVAAVAPSGVIARHGVFDIRPTRLSARIICALLNSTWVAKYVASSCAGFHKESFGRVTAKDLRTIPIPLSLLDEADAPESRRVQGEVVRLVKCLRGKTSKTAWSRDHRELDALIEACLSDDRVDSHGRGTSHGE
jgi:TaqI-like C-terminal specificity domain/N-6 DNA Methylase